MSTSGKAMTGRFWHTSRKKGESHEMGPHCYLGVASKGIMRQPSDSLNSTQSLTVLQCCSLKQTISSEELSGY